MSIAFPGGKRKCLTFSYDDGVRQDIKLIEIFKKYGMKATFNLNSGNLGTVGRINHMGFDVCFDKMKPEEVKDLYRQEDGFEVAVHGSKHRNFPTLEDDEELSEEIGDDKKRLEELSGQKIIGAAYPCGVYDVTMPEKLGRFGISYCRTINDTHSFAIPDNFVFWHPTCHDNYEYIFDLARDFIAYDGDEPALFYIWGHSFELDKNDRDRWGNIRRICKLLSGRDDVWYATNGEVYSHFANQVK